MCADTTQSSIGYIHQVNIYYGIYFPADQCEMILSLLKTNRIYSGLATESEVSINDIVIIASVSSDKPGKSQLGFIALDNMTISGDEYDDAEDISVSIDPQSMLDAQLKNAQGMGIITDIYEYIVKGLKAAKKGKLVSELEQCWKAVSCTWEEESESDSSAPIKKKAAKTPKRSKKSAKRSPEAATPAIGATSQPVGTDSQPLPEWSGKSAQSMTQQPADIKGPVLDGKSAVKRKPREPKK
jgi:hypothetical protein